MQRYQNVPSIFYKKKRLYKPTQVVEPFGLYVPNVEQQDV